MTGTKRGKQVFFNQSEVYQLDAAHYFLSKGYGLKDLKSASVSFDSDSTDSGSRSLLLSIPMSQNWLLHLNKKENMALTASIREALQSTTPPPPRDPLLAYRQLQEAFEQKYQLTSQPS